MQKIIELKLKWLARKIIEKYRPRIIGITGSVGKTSAKFMIGTVLKQDFRVRWAEKNYNNELGLPLAIIDAQAQGKNILGWFSVFFKAMGLIVRDKTDYPEILILEMGVDKPGDMDYLLSIVRPQIAVITNISESHLENFSSKEQIQAEKGKLAAALPRDGVLFVNFDSPEAYEQAAKTQAKTISYGLNEGADLLAQGIQLDYHSDEFSGMTFTFAGSLGQGTVSLPGLLGYNHVYAALAALAVGRELGLETGRMSASLEYPALARGRMNVIAGIKNTTLIDDSYNSSPQSAISALAMLKMMKLPPGARRMAVLADMLELGSYSEAGHRQVGTYARDCGIDYLFTVGERARDISRGALAAGMSEDRIFNFADRAEAGLFIQDRLKTGDIVLIKGSRGLRMEELVRELMSDPLKAPELLVSHEP